MATDELAKKLERREKINEGDEESVIKSNQVWNPYTEFKEFSRKQIIDFQKTFKKYDTGNDSFIDFNELKYMMEKLDSPQTHLALKAMIKEIDEDNDDKINFREFLLIFRKANAGELLEGSGLQDLFNNMTEIDVHAEGVKGAKSFFEAKIDNQTRDKKFEDEIKQEQEEKKKQLEEAKERKQAFKEKASMWK